MANYVHFTWAGPINDQTKSAALDNPKQYAQLFPEQQFIYYCLESEVESVREAVINQANIKVVSIESLIGEFAQIDQKFPGTNDLINKFIADMQQRCKEFYSTWPQLPHDLPWPENSHSLAWGIASPNLYLPEHFSAVITAEQISHPLTALIGSVLKNKKYYNVIKECTQLMALALHGGYHLDTTIEPSIITDEQNESFKTEYQEWILKQGSLTEKIELRHWTLNDLEDLKKELEQQKLESTIVSGGDGRNQERLKEINELIEDIEHILLVPEDELQEYSKRFTFYPHAVTFAGSRDYFLPFVSDVWARYSPPDRCAEFAPAHAAGLLALIANLQSPDASQTAPYQFIIPAAAVHSIVSAIIYSNEQFLRYLHHTKLQYRKAPGMHDLSGSTPIGIHITAFPGIKVFGTTNWNQGKQQSENDKYFEKKLRQKIHDIPDFVREAFHRNWKNVHELQDVCDVLLEKIKGGAFKIEGARDIIKVLKAIQDPQQQSRVGKVLLDKIESLREFSDIARAFEPVELYPEINEIIEGLTKGTINIKLHNLRTLETNIKSRPEVIDYLVENIASGKDEIQDLCDFGYLLRGLNEEQTKSICIKLKDKIADKINRHDLYGMWNELQNKQITCFCETFKNEIGNNIKSTDDYLNLSPPFCRDRFAIAAYTPLKGILSRVVKNESDLEKFKSFLPPELINELRELSSKEKEKQERKGGEETPSPGEFVGVKSPLIQSGKIAETPLPQDDNPQPKPPR